MSKRHLGRLAIAIVVVALGPAAWAQGGPPLMTDDPDTPGPGHDQPLILDRAHVHEHRLESPLLDLNYGVGRRIQYLYVGLQFNLPNQYAFKDLDRAASGR